MNRIIKGASALAPGSSRASVEAPGVVVAANVYDAQQHAQAIVAQAARDAEALIAEANVEGARLREAALEEGRQVARGEATELLARARAERDELLRRDEGEILEMALLAASKILGREVELLGAAADIVAQALSASRRAKQVRVRIHPDDEPAVRASQPALVARLDPAAGFALVSDPSVPRGGCVVETEGGRIDARIDVQLQALRRALCGDGEGA